MTNYEKNHRLSRKKEKKEMIALTLAEAYEILEEVCYEKDEKERLATLIAMDALAKQIAKTPIKNGLEAQETNDNPELRNDEKSESSDKNKAAQFIINRFLKVN